MELHAGLGEQEVAIDRGIDRLGKQDDRLRRIDIAGVVV